MVLESAQGLVPGLVLVPESAQGPEPAQELELVRELVPHSQQPLCYRSAPTP